MTTIASTESLRTTLSNIDTNHLITESIHSGIQSITEISSGNVNQIFKVMFNNGLSCIAKYAPPFAYRYQEIAINNERNAFEAEVLSIFFAKNNANYPELFYFSPKNHLMLMQDLSHCADMREALIQGKIFKNFAKTITEVFLQYPSGIKSDKKIEHTPFSFGEGIPELQAITKDFVFQCPFGLSFPDGVVCLEENLEWAKENIFENKKVLNQREKLEAIYNNKKETLLHGDLHTGSIMLNDSEVYIIDPEFAKIGPISFDIGMLIGNLVISYIAAEHHLANNLELKCKFQNWILTSISDLWKNSVEALSKTGFENTSLNQEIAGFCAIEIIRRTIGGAQAKDFTSIADQNIRAKLELSALKMSTFILMSEAQTPESLLVELKKIL